MSWMVGLRGGPFDGRRLKLLGDDQPDDAPPAVRVYICPCCRQTAVPAPGSGVERELEEWQAPWWPYRLTRAAAQERFAIYEYVTADTIPDTAEELLALEEPTPDLLEVLVP